MALDVWQSHACFTLFLFLALPTARQRPILQWLILAALFAVSCIAVDTLAVAAYLRSVIGQPAITTLLLMSAITLTRLHIGNVAANQVRQVALVFAALGLLLYPAALGLTQFDPYRLGYDPEFLLIVVGASAAWLLFRHNHFGAWLLALATVAFVIDLQASDNYWDYLVDPFLVVSCYFIVARQLSKMLVQRIKRRLQIPMAEAMPGGAPVAP